MTLPKITSGQIQAAANLATILAAIVAALAFWYGYDQFKETQKDARQVLKLQDAALDQERESRAVDLFVKYNEVMKEPRSGKRSGQVEEEFWRGNLAVSIAESIFRLRKDDTGWKETVVWMLSNHVKHLKTNGLDCPTFDQDFVKLANEQTHDDLCRPR